MPGTSTFTTPKADRRRSPSPGEQDGQEQEWQEQGEQEQDEQETDEPAGQGGQEWRPTGAVSAHAAKKYKKSRRQRLKQKHALKNSVADAGLAVGEAAELEHAPLKSAATGVDAGSALGEAADLERALRERSDRWVGG